MVVRTRANKAQRLQNSNFAISAPFCKASQVAARVLLINSQPISVCTREKRNNRDEINMYFLKLLTLSALHFII
jgi:hypothetical protein